METSEDKKCCETKKCGCCCHKMPGIFIILMGVVILVNCFGGLSERGAWIAIGVLLILFGLNKICSGCCKCCDKPGAESCCK